MYKVDVCKLALTCCSDISAPAHGLIRIQALIHKLLFWLPWIEAILRAVDVTTKDGMRLSSSACSDLG